MNTGNLLVFLAAGLVIGFILSFLYFKVSTSKKTKEIYYKYEDMDHVLVHIFVLSGLSNKKFKLLVSLKECYAA